MSPALVREKNRQSASTVREVSSAAWEVDHQGMVGSADDTPLMNVRVWRWIAVRVRFWA